MKCFLGTPLLGILADVICLEAVQIIVQCRQQLSSVEDAKLLYDNEVFDSNDSDPNEETDYYESPSAGFQKLNLEANTIN